MKSGNLIISLLSIITLAMVGTSAQAQVQTYVSTTEKLLLKFDPTQESIEVPTMEDFGRMHGYMQGYHENRGEPYLYGVWTVTKVQDEGKKGIMMHLCNDGGSETQEAHLRQKNDSTWILHLDGQTVIKRAVNRKLVKVSTDLLFQKN